MATLKNLAPYTLEDYNTGVSDQQFMVGDEYIGARNTRFERVRMIGSVTGRRFSMCVATSSPDGANGREYSHDISDTAAGLHQFAGISQGSRMTAVTHFMWVQRGGDGPMITPAVTSLIVAGEKLYVSTTDKGAAHYISTTTNAGTHFAVSLERWGVTASVSKIVRLV